MTPTAKVGRARTVRVGACSRDEHYGSAQDHDAGTAHRSISPIRYLASSSTTESRIVVLGGVQALEIALLSDH
jgi:hypothetical protein